MRCIWLKGVLPLGWAVANTVAALPFVVEGTREIAILGTTGLIGEADSGASKQ